MNKVSIKSETQSEIQPNELVLWMRDHSDQYRSNPIVWVEPKPEAEPDTSHGPNGEIEAHDEQYTVIYYDKFVVLTTFECCYALWHRSSGELIFGKSWNKDHRITAKSLMELI